MVRGPLSIVLVLATAATLAVRALASEEPARPDRARAAAEAGRTFLRTNLFAEGRGMHVTPGLLGAWRAAPDRVGPVPVVDGVRDRLGLLPAERGETLGVFEVPAEGTRVGVLGCAACHAGRAAGRTYAGLGNKAIDVGAIGATVAALGAPEFAARALAPAGERRLVEESMSLASLLADDRWTNLTRGLVPVAMIRQWFYRQAGEEVPTPFPRGAVKAPHLWGYGEKAAVGQFCDGFGSGHEPGWAAAVELAAGQSPEALRRMLPRLHEVEALFSAFLPPVYPFPIDAALAERGRAVFEETCAGCHGGYRRDAEGHPLFEAPRHVAWDVVRTDRDRLDGITPQFRALVAASPVADLLAATDLPPGYFAPRLEGVWARYGYLHNASVPTLAAMLTPPERRPRAWSLADAGERRRFDAGAVGYTLPAPGSAEEASLLRRAAAGDRAVYSVERPGQSNAGHEFGTTLPDASRVALLEYLKSL